MLYLILFWHPGDKRPAIRVIRGTRNEADCSRDRIAEIYEDIDARVVEIADTRDDYDDIVAMYDILEG